MYYAAISSSASFPAPVIGWDYDRQKEVFATNGIPQMITEPPPASPRFTLIPLPNKDDVWWNNPERWQQSWLVDEKGNLTAAPPPVIPLKEQAQSAFRRARQQFTDLQMMGETFGPKMQAYMRSLNAIINGTDTTSTTLPTAPADPQS